MAHPSKVICEMTAAGYSIVVLDDAGAQMFRTEHVMESRGESSGDGQNIFECEALKEFSDLAEQIDDLCFGQFDVCGELYQIAKDLA